MSNTIQKTKLQPLTSYSCYNNSGKISSTGYERNLFNIKNWNTLAPNSIFFVKKQTVTLQKMESLLIDKPGKLIDCYVTVNAPSQSAVTIVQLYYELREINGKQQKIITTAELNVGNTKMLCKASSLLTEVANKINGAFQVTEAKVRYNYETKLFEIMTNYNYKYEFSPELRLNAKPLAGAPANIKRCNMTPTDIQKLNNHSTTVMLCQQIKQFPQGSFDIIRDDTGVTGIRINASQPFTVEKDTLKYIMSNNIATFEGLKLSSNGKLLTNETRKQPISKEIKAEYDTVLSDIANNVTTIEQQINKLFQMSHVPGTSNVIINNDNVIYTEVSCDYYSITKPKLLMSKEHKPEIHFSSEIHYYDIAKCVGRDIPLNMCFPNIVGTFIAQGLFSTL